MNAPGAIRNLREPGALVLQWADGERSISHARLRGACPCSQCRAARLAGRIAVVREDVRVERVEVQGYGVQLVFSDGHERGIYPWAYLHDLG
nr:gamma-butyrobetaine hydroxylase-like domain-containing protein [uncultured Pseudomonas sp.]